MSKAMTRIAQLRLSVLLELPHPLVAITGDAVQVAADSKDFDLIHPVLIPSQIRLGQCQGISRGRKD